MKQKSGIELGLLEKKQESQEASYEDGTGDVEIEATVIL